MVGRVLEVKVLPEYFVPAVAGIKRFSIRKNDRNYQVGDTIYKREWDPATGVYTGREATFLITYITGFGQPPGQVVLGIELLQAYDWNKVNGGLLGNDEGEPGLLTICRERVRGCSTPESATFAQKIEQLLSDSRV
ncbi:DUF3850 domain-containing protein [Paenibacillus elgii]|uniref:DUF3850 domain-containing protein n=1 Tax=Paenibacillus elgii TaxID=189691 RepID=UPI0007C7DD1C|nr:DUF3850 domain-containing protein [Paenibacillus elgii]